MSADAQRELLKEALVTIRALKAELRAAEQARTEPIAIVGLGCRLPGGVDSPEAYWRLLRDGVDAIGDLPADRWPHALDQTVDAQSEARSEASPSASSSSPSVRRGGFLRDIKGFDADFFGIAPREAARLDPQQRLLLEVSWEALEHAGLAPDRLAGRATGIYVGAMSTDYAARQVHRLAPRDADPYMLTGNDLSFAAGRLAYFLGVHGPAMVISTACSSSLVAVHLAAQALRAGECELALAGGVNLVLDPTTMAMLSKLRALAPDGTCKTFDAAADGYGRGEGCGVVVLERLSTARANGHRVLAVLRGSAVNHDGPSAGLTVPNGRAQEALLRQALAAAGVTADELSYVEAHGTGTALGDPIELHALARVLGERRRPLLVGSVKTNIGHLEPAAGIAGLIKVVLALRHDRLPAHLHFTQPSPHIRWSDLPLQVATKTQPWPVRAGERRLAGVSAFGLSGVNAHVVLEEAPDTAVATSAAHAPGAPGVANAVDAVRASGAANASAADPRGRAKDDTALRVLPLSARTPEALAALVARYRAFLATSSRDTDAATHHAALRDAASRGAAFRGAASRDAGTTAQTAAQAAAGAAEWADICYTASAGRAHFAHRVAVTARSAAEAASALARLDDVRAGAAEDRDGNGGETGRVATRPAARAAAASAGADASTLRLIFGSTPPDGAAGRAWLASSSAFRQSLERSVAALAAASDITRADAPADARALIETPADHPLRPAADVSILVALAQVWKVWTGHTDDDAPLRVEATDRLGELAAAVVSGDITLDEALAHAPGATRRLAIQTARFAASDIRLDASSTIDASRQALADSYARGVSIDWMAVAQDDLSGPRRPVTLPTYPFQREEHWALDETSSAAEATAVTVASSGQTDDLAAPLSAVANAPRVATIGAAAPSLDVVAQELRSVLGLRHGASVDPDRALLDLGLDSLMSMELRDRLRERFGLDIELAPLLSGASLRDVLAMLDASAASHAAASHAVASHGAASPAAASHAATSPDAAPPEAPSRGAMSSTSPSNSSPAAATDDVAIAASSSAPLSYGQRALWFLHASDPASAAYNVGLALRVSGPVDVSALRRACQTLVDRHAALRTRFTVEAGVPMQIVDPAAPVSFDRLDATGWTESALEARLRDACHAPFDLAAGPLLRVTFATHTADAHVLLFTMHHIVCDAVSCWTLLEDLQHAYAAARDHLTPQLPPLAATYADFVSWQHTFVHSPEGEQQWRFWQQQLAGPLPLLDLPTDAPRPPVQTYNGASHRFTIGAPLTQALKALARAEQSTLYTALLAAFHVLLHRYSGQEDIIIGSPTAARPTAFARTPGYFVNPLPIRADLSGAPDFVSLLRQVRTRVLDAMAHHAFPFPLLVERLQPRRDPSRTPIFQADFTLGQPATAYRDGLTTALALSRFDLAEEEGQFDLGLHVVDEGDRLSVRLTYNTDLFQPATAARMAESFAMLLEQIAEQPRRAIGELRLLSDAERARVLALGVGPRVDWPADTLPERFERQAAATPDAIAVEMFTSRAGAADGAAVAPLATEASAASLAPGATNRTAPGETLTYRELNRRANRLARELRARGVRPDVLVGVCLTPSIDLVVSLLAILKAGGAYLPLDPAYPVERLAFMIGDAAVATLLTTRAIHMRLSETLQQTAARVSSAPPLSIVTLDEVAADTRDAIDLRATDATDDANLPCVSTPDHLAYVIYTSGSTGLPKGAMITHRGLTNYLSWALDAYRVAEGSGAPVSSSIAFDATVTSFFAPLLTGGTVLLLPDEGMVEALAEALTASRGFSLVKITPAHLDVLAQLLPSGATPLTTLTNPANAFVIGGEALRGETVAFWQRVAPRTRLINEYGPTETVVGCCIYEASQPQTSGSVPIGRAIANTQLYVLDAHMQPVPAGVIGELYIGGDGVARGYWQRPELTAARFVRDPFAPADRPARLYRTGDLARWRNDGELDYVGRIDAQVKLRGFRIELGEIETVLAEHPAIAHALVIVREHPTMGRQLVAYTVGEGPAGEGPAPDAAALRAHLAARLPDYMIPAAFVALDAFPLTPNGKVDRAALPAPALAEAARTIAPPRDRLEMTLAALWAETLGVATVGREENFFDLGGHSLLAVRLLARVERAIGGTVSLATILRAPTIEAMARVLRASDVATTTTTATVRESALVPIQTAGTRPPFFCVPGAGGNPIYLQALARHLGPDQPFYGLQGAGFDGTLAPHTTVEAMAAYYIEAIQALQPAGPYHLGGHSLGGWVAYEMGRQLRAQGHAVPIVAIIDTPTPPAAADDRRMEWDDARWIAELADRIGKLMAPDLRVEEAALRALAAEAQIDRFRQALVDAGAYPAEGGAAHIRHTLEVFKAHARVSYHAPRESGLDRLVLLRTAHEPAHVAWEPDDVSWGWRRCAPTEVHVLPGDHLAVLRPPHVAALAERLSACLVPALELTR